MPEAGVLRGGTTILPGVEVRVLDSESHYHSAQPTRYGVESGKTISDHAILQPNELSIRFEMTNTDNGVEAARDVFQQIDKMLQNRELITVDTEHARYKNMIVAGFGPEHRSPYRGALIGDIRLVQVGIIGESDNVSATGGRPARVLAKDGANKTACNYIYAGRQQPNEDRVTLDACMAQLQRMVAG